MAKEPTKFLLSVVIPIFNEAEGIEHFFTALYRIVEDNAWNYEIIAVDDGSTDETPNLLRKSAAKDSRLKVLTLSRNFGKEQATTAGLNIAGGDAVVIIDADGQHPVELLPQFVAQWQKGAHVVVGVRTSNQREGIV